MFLLCQYDPSKRKNTLISRVGSRKKMYQILMQASRDHNLVVCVGN